MYYLSKYVDTLFLDLETGQKRQFRIDFRPEKPYHFFQDIPVYLLRKEDKYEVNIGNIMYETSIANGDEIEAVAAIWIEKYKKYKKKLSGDELEKFIKKTSEGYLPAE